MHLAPRPVTCRCDSWCSLSHAVGPGRARGLAAPRFFVRALGFALASAAAQGEEGARQLEGLIDGSSLGSSEKEDL